MIRPLDCADMADAAVAGWLPAFTADFARRFAALLGFEFRDLPATLALGMLVAAGVRAEAPAGEEGGAGARGGGGGGDGGMHNRTGGGGGEGEGGGGRLSARDLAMWMTPHDVRRLDSYVFRARARTRARGRNRLCRRAATRGTWWTTTW